MSNEAKHTPPKPCPFCGGDAVLKNGGPGNHFVICSVCLAAGDDALEERAVSVWNRRAPDEATQRLLVEAEEPSHPYCDTCRGDRFACNCWEGW